MSKESNFIYDVTSVNVSPSREFVVKLLLNLETSNLTLHFEGCDISVDYSIHRFKTQRYTQENLKIRSRLAALIRFFFELSYVKLILFVLYAYLENFHSISAANSIANAARYLAPSSSTVNQSWIPPFLRSPTILRFCYFVEDFDNFGSTLKDRYTSADTIGAYFDRELWARGDCSSILIFERIRITQVFTWRKNMRMKILALPPVQEKKGNFVELFSKIISVIFMRLSKYVEPNKKFFRFSDSLKSFENVKNGWAKNVHLHKETCPGLTHQHLVYSAVQPILPYITALYWIIEEKRGIIVVIVVEVVERGGGGNPGFLIYRATFLRGWIYFFS